MKRINLRLVILLISIALSPVAFAQQNPLFKVVAFYTAKSDLAHISFVHEANRWFPKAAAENNFTYDSTNDWSNLNEAFLKTITLFCSWILGPKPRNNGRLLKTI